MKVGGLMEGGIREEFMFRRAEGGEYLPRFISKTGLNPIYYSLLPV